jgi:hypothetical protein
MVNNKLPEIGKRVLVRGVLALYLSVFALLTGAGPLSASGPWPEGLREAVNSYFQTLQVTDYRTRDSTLEEPLGVQPMTEFDRAGHKCHEVPGQVYRIYKIPNYFSEDTDGSFLVRSKFYLFYRQADSVAEIFSKPWEQGSNGAIQVRFEQVGGKWEAVDKREILE